MEGLVLTRRKVNHLSLEVGRPGRRGNVWGW